MIITYQIEKSINSNYKKNQMKIVFWNQTFKRTQNKSELTEERIIKFKDGWIQIMLSAKQKKKWKIKSENCGKLWNKPTYSKGISKREEERSRKNIWRYNHQSSSKLILKTYITLHPRWWTPSGLNTKRDTFVHIIVKTIESQEKILKVARKTYEIKGDNNKIRLTAHFSLETMEARGSGIINQMHWMKKFTSHNLWPQ